MSGWERGGQGGKLISLSHVPKEAFRQRSGGREVESGVGEECWLDLGFHFLCMEQGLQWCVFPAQGHTAMPRASPPPPPPPQAVEVWGGGRQS